MTSPIFALIDCNNFFVSCLRVFRPDLEGKPVVALSSNDGCVVARSNEAKSLGIPMGVPAFKWRQFFKDNSVIQMSGNFELYGDMSKRITSILTTITPLIEIYSVDESFLDLSELNISNYTEWGSKVSGLIEQWTGIPVSVGVAGSKTLAKLASERVKKDPDLDSVLDLYSLNKKERSKFLTKTPIQDVWGVGYRLAPKLRGEFIATADDFSRITPQFANQLMGVHGRQIVAELNGISCLPLKKFGKPAQSISVTRTFGEDTNQLHVIESALSSFAAKAAFKLRLHNQQTNRIGFFMTTNRHKPGYKSFYEELKLTSPTSDTGKLTSLLINMMSRHYSDSYHYHRAGVWLYDLHPDSSPQLDLMGNTNLLEQNSSQRRMKALDNINSRYGKGTMYFAIEDLGKSWQPKNEIKMPRFTTRWDELPNLKLGRYELEPNLY